jgi:hypothetical protein
MEGIRNPLEYLVGKSEVKRPIKDLGADEIILFR